MYKKILLSSLSLFILSCSSKDLNKKEYELMALQNTKKTDIVKNGDVKYIFWATHLNAIEDDKKNENFLLSFYDVNSNKNIADVRLNGEKYTSLKKVNKDDKKFKSLVRKNPWGENYLVKFKKQKKDKLNITIEGEIKLTFTSKF